METEKSIETMPYVSKIALSNYLNKNVNTLRNSITYWVQNKSLIRLKRGFFVFRSFIGKKENAFYYPRFLATKMIEPSYLSKEFVLQEYQMLTDVVYGYSIVTTKKTNVLKNEFGDFRYQSIKKELFEGFSMQSYDDMHWFMASKAKALFDYIYFNQHKFQEYSKKELFGLRLNLEVMNAKDWKEYEKYIAKASPKMMKIYTIMEKNVPR